MGRWIRTHPFTTVGAVSLAALFLFASGGPFRVLWNVLMLPAWMYTMLLSRVWDSPGPSPSVAVDLFWFCLRYATYFAPLVGIDGLIARASRRRDPYDLSGG